MAYHPRINVKLIPQTVNMGDEAPICIDIINFYSNRLAIDQFLQLVSRSVSERLLFLGRIDFRQAYLDRTAWREFYQETVAIEDLADYSGIVLFAGDRPGEKQQQK